MSGSTPKVPILDLGAQYAASSSEIHRAIERVLSSQHFVLGPEVDALERDIAAYTSRKYAVAVASGTDALLLSLKAAGIGPGDEVIVPAFTFVATADTVSLLGATPVFADIDPVSYCIDQQHLRELITPRTKALIAVHLYGHPAAMEELGVFAADHGLVLIGDAAQALGARLQGIPVCSMGDFTCLSFFPSKNLGAYGDGGMILTDDSSNAELLRMLRAHGSRVKYEHQMLGWNSRLDALQAAILSAKFKHLEDWNQQRRRVAHLYGELLQDLDDVIPPVTADGATHVFHQYTVRVPQRDIIQKEMSARGIETAVHYPIPLHLQPMYRDLGYSVGSLPRSEQAAREVLSLPMYPELQLQQVERVCEALRAALESCATEVASSH